MILILKLPFFVFRSLVTIFIFFGLPIAFMGLGAGYIEISCIKNPKPECLATEAFAFGIYPKTQKITEVKKAKVKLSESYSDLILLSDNQTIIVNKASNNSKVRNIRKLKKNINRFLKDNSQISFQQKSTYLTPFFILGILGSIFSIWFIVSSLLIYFQPERNQKVQIIISQQPKIHELIKNLNLFYIPNISLTYLGNIILLLAFLCSLGLMIDCFYYKNFDEITFFWIVFLAPTFKLAFWIKSKPVQVRESL